MRPYPTTIRDPATGMYVSASKAALFRHFGLGIPLAVYVPHAWVEGTVTSISLESGFTPPDKPRHFNVTLQTDDGPREVYVRTAD